MSRLKPLKPRVVIRKLQSWDLLALYQEGNMYAWYILKGV